MNDLVERLRNRIGYDATVERMIDEATNELERLHKIEAAAKNLTAQKGRHNTEQAYRKLEEAMK